MRTSTARRWKNRWFPAPSELLLSPLVAETRAWARRFAAFTVPQSWIGDHRTRRGQVAAPVRSSRWTGEPARSLAVAVRRNRSSLVEVTSSPAGACSTLWIRSVRVLPDCCGAITPVAFSNGSHRSWPVTAARCSGMPTCPNAARARPRRVRSGRVTRGAASARGRGQLPAHIGPGREPGPGRRGQPVEHPAQPDACRQDGDAEQDGDTPVQPGRKPDIEHGGRVGWAAQHAGDESRPLSRWGCGQSATGEQDGRPSRRPPASAVRR